MVRASGSTIAAEATSAFLAFERSRIVRATAAGVAVAVAAITLGRRTSGSPRDTGRKVKHAAYRWAAPVAARALAYRARRTVLEVDGANAGWARHFADHPADLAQATSYAGHFLGAGDHEGLARWMEPFAVIDAEAAASAVVRAAAEYDAGFSRSTDAAPDRPLAAR